jgi:MFS family permease
MGPKFEKLAESMGANRAVVALSAGRLGDAVGNSILFVVIPLYVARLPSPWLPFSVPVRAGLVLSLFGIVNVVLQPYFSVLSDRLSMRKTLIQAGLLVMAASTFAYVFAGRFIDLLVLRALQGVGFAVTLPASMSLMAIITKPKTRGASMGVYSTARMLGLGLGPLMGGYLYDRFGFDAAFYVGTGFILAALVLVQLWVREVLPPGGKGKREKRELRFLDRNLLTPGVLGAGLAAFAMANAFSMITPLEREFNERLDQSAFAFGIAFSSVMVSRFLFQIPAGKLSDRLGRKPVIIAGLLVMAPFTALLAAAGSTDQLIFFRLMQGVGSAGVAAPAFALAADLSIAGGEGRQMSITTMGFSLGIALGPLLSGVLSAFSFELPFLAGSAILLAVAWIIHRHVPETVSGRREQGGDVGSHR